MARLYLRTTAVQKRNTWVCTHVHRRHFGLFSEPVGAGHSLVLIGFIQVLIIAGNNLNKTTSKKPPKLWSRISPEKSAHICSSQRDVRAQTICFTGGGSSWVTTLDLFLSCTQLCVLDVWTFTRLTLFRWVFEHLSKKVQVSKQTRSSMAHSSLNQRQWGVGYIWTGTL